MFLRSYSGNFVKAVCSVFPEIGLEKSKFSKSTSMFVFYNHKYTQILINLFNQEKNDVLSFKNRDCVFIIINNCCIFRRIIMYIHIPIAHIGIQFAHCMKLLLHI